MKRCREPDENLNGDRLFKGLVRGSGPDGRSAFSNLPPSSSCGLVRGIEVPVGAKSDGGGAALVEVKEDESGECVRTESVGGGRVGACQAKRKGGKGAVSSGAVFDESEENVQQQRTSPKKCDRKNSLTSTGKDEQKKAENVNKEASYHYHHQRQPLNRAESFAMLKKMVETQHKWLPETDKVTGSPMSKKRSPYAYGKRWKFLTWMIEMSNVFNMSRDTVSIAMNYLDRYTCSQEHSAVVVQVAASASLFLAAKVEENDHLKVKALKKACVGAFKEEQLLAMEKDLLKVLQWQLRPLTPYDAVGPFLSLLDWSHRPVWMEVDQNQLTREVDVLLDLSHFDNQTVHFPPVTKVVAGLVLALASPRYHFGAPVINAEGKACRVYDIDRAMIVKTCHEVGLAEECSSVSLCATRMLNSYWEALRPNGGSKEKSIEQNSLVIYGRDSPTGVAELEPFLEEESAKVALDSLTSAGSKSVNTVNTSDAKVLSTTKEITVIGGIDPPPSKTQIDRISNAPNAVGSGGAPPPKTKKSTAMKPNDMKEGRAKVKNRM